MIVVTKFHLDFLPAKGTYVADLAINAESIITMLTIGVVSRVMVPGNTGYFHLELLEAIRHELMQVISGSHMDALIYIGPFDNIALNRLDSIKLPSVIPDHSATGIPIDSVTSDNRGDGYLAIKHLLSLGHKKISIVAGDENQT